MENWSQFYVRLLCICVSSHFSFISKVITEWIQFPCVFLPRLQIVNYSHVIDFLCVFEWIETCSRKCNISFKIYLKISLDSKISITFFIKIKTYSRKCNISFKIFKIFLDSQISTTFFIKIETCRKKYNISFKIFKIYLDSQISMTFFITSFNEHKILSDLS